jgi:hypothetical protein
MALERRKRLARVRNSSRPRRLARVRNSSHALDSFFGMAAPYRDADALFEDFNGREAKEIRLLERVEKVERPPMNKLGRGYDKTIIPNRFE